jgi:hypothetical protein
MEFIESSHQTNSLSAEVFDDIIWRDGITIKGDVGSKA